MPLATPRSERKNMNENRSIWTKGKFKKEHQTAMQIAKVQQAFSECVQKKVKFDSMGEVKLFVLAFEDQGFEASLIREAIESLPSDKYSSSFLSEWDMLMQML